VIENHRGQWLRHTDATGTRDYAYDKAGRLKDVKDYNSGLTTCTRRTYDFDSRGNRTTLRTTQGTGT
jgi:YD repeat-containing protein